MGTREKAIADQESARRHRGAEIDRQAAAMAEAQRGIDDKTKRYTDLFKDTKMKEAVVGSTAEDMRRQKEALSAREKKIADMQANLQSEVKRGNEERSGHRVRAKELEQRESAIK